uniref:Matrix metallopeptidase 15a n=1 Tax=Sinocyclocheilus grahami TaxID=75366 RepID=A0A672SLL8_SINGR
MVICFFSQVCLLKPFFHPGECEISQCCDPATCILSLRRTCKFAVGYFGDLCDQVDEEFFKYYNVAVEAVNLTNASCRVHRGEISGSSYFVLFAHTNGPKNIMHIAYSLMLMSDPPVYGNIVRDPVVQTEYKCIYTYIPFTSTPTIKLGDKIYVQIQVTEPEDFFHLRVNYEGSTVRAPQFLPALHLCTPEDGKSCIPECKTVSKREVVMDEQAQGLLSYGPIRWELFIITKAGI